MFFHVQRKGSKLKSSSCKGLITREKNTPDLLPDLESKVQIVPLLVSLKNSVLKNYFAVQLRCPALATSIHIKCEGSCMTPACVAGSFGSTLTAEGGTALR